MPNKIVTTHYRYPDRQTPGFAVDLVYSHFTLRGYGVMPSPRGGATEVEIFSPNGNILSRGVARCHPNDNFNRKLGRTIALGRAMKHVEELPVLKRIPDGADGSSPTWIRHDA